MLNPINIIVDSREQKPYSFPDHLVTVAGLKVGDYSLKGYEDRVSIERKTLGDLVSSLSHGRDRFQRELERGRDLAYFALIVESSMESILRGQYRSKMLPQAVLGSLTAYSVRYRLPVFFADNRQGGQRITQDLLLKYFNEIEGHVKAVA